jgi:retron-type reverse transcriptase
MGELKAGEPFGLDREWVKRIDWELARKRVMQDQRSDFIYAPHLSFVYARAGEEVITQLKKELSAGTFSAGLPMTIEVPKSYRIQIAATHTRFGPNYSRPGSILMPKDRIFYQAIADQAAPIIDKATDHHRSFSHQLAAPDAASMFLPTRTCWSRLQKANQEYVDGAKAKYILRVDIANFFGSINLHTLVNVLNDVKYPASLLGRLESILTSFTNERSSRGILQGMYPSDLLGNFYLAPIDQFLEELGIESTRYVDDLYIFLDSVDAAEQLLRKLIPKLRSYDLSLNEAKSKILPIKALFAEEPDLETLFEAAVAEVSEQMEDDDFDADYGFQAEWEDEDAPEEGDEDASPEEGAEDDSELTLEATKLLFDSISKYPGYEENIERFCLPLFARTGSEYALDHVIESFKRRPSMSQIYAAYLAGFLQYDDTVEFLESALGDDSMMDWQRMWILAALMRDGETSPANVKAALSILKDGSRHDALRAVAAVFVGDFGDHSRRKELTTLYPTLTEYVRAAIFFSSRKWPTVERKNAKVAWSNQGPLNQLLAKAMDIKKKAPAAKSN